MSDGSFLNFNRKKIEDSKMEADDTSHTEKPERRHTFKLGDTVSFGGVQGVVVGDSSVSGVYPTEVSFLATGELLLFTADGRLYEHHTEPLLKLVKAAPKKKAKLEEKRYAVVPNNKSLKTVTLLDVFANEDMAKELATVRSKLDGGTFYQIVPITWTYEVEVE
jgi:hypothetical protein